MGNSRFLDWFLFWWQLRRAPSYHPTMKRISCTQVSDDPPGMITWTFSRKICRAHTVGSNKSSITLIRRGGELFYFRHYCVCSALR
jgi:hypothetical protein